MTPPISSVRTRIATANVLHSLNQEAAKSALEEMLAYNPDIFGLNEWPASRIPLLRETGRVYRPIRRESGLFPGHPISGYVWVKPLLGGNPIGLKAERFHLKKSRLITLAKGRKVKSVDGRRDKLPDNTATLLVFDDLLTGLERAHLQFHFNSHVEKNGHYRGEDPNGREAMHKEEVARTEAIARNQIQHHGRRFTAAGDTNWHKLQLEGLIENSMGHRDVTSLHRRFIDMTFAERMAFSVMTVKTLSDHDGVVTTYKEPGLIIGR